MVHGPCKHHVRGYVVLTWSPLGIDHHGPWTMYVLRRAYMVPTWFLRGRGHHGPNWPPRSTWFLRGFYMVDHVGTT
jgi:hypothetical protein